MSYQRRPHDDSDLNPDNDQLPVYTSKPEASQADAPSYTPPPSRFKNDASFSSLPGTGGSLPPSKSSGLMFSMSGVGSTNSVQGGLADGGLKMTSTSSTFDPKWKDNVGSAGLSSDKVLNPDLTNAQVESWKKNHVPGLSKEDYRSTKYDQSRTAGKPE